MKDDGTRVEVYGREFTGWKAKLIVFAVVATLVGAGFSSGWRAGVSSTHSEAAHD